MIAAGGRSRLPHRQNPHYQDQHDWEDENAKAAGAYVADDHIAVFEKVDHEAPSAAVLRWRSFPGAGLLGVG